MVKAAHTPGPWQTNVDDFGTSNTGGAYVGVYDDFGKTLAHVLCRDIVGSGGENPYAANARLIAAAPDLLEALEGLLRLHQSHNRETTPEEIAAEYAIAKAKGEQA